MSNLAALWGWGGSTKDCGSPVARDTSPLQQPESPVSMPGVRSAADVSFTSDEVFLIFDETIDSGIFGEAQSKGCLFGKSIEANINKHANTLERAISKWPTNGFFQDKQVQDALTILNNNLPEDNNVDRETPLRIQAFNFCKY